jgi:DNA-binding XRE family transcriptional regulator
MFLGYKLTQLRQAKNISHDHLSSAIFRRTNRKVSSACLHQLEKGIRKNPKMSTIYPICKFFKKRMEYFCEE